MGRFRRKGLRTEDLGLRRKGLRTKDSVLSTPSSVLSPQSSVLNLRSSALLTGAGRGLGVGARACRSSLSRRHKLGHPLPSRIAVFRALQLGDLLCAVPAMRALRAALPHTHITLIGLPWAGSFAERFHDYLDGFIAFPGAPGLPERAPGPGELEAFLAQVRQQHFDLALQLHGSGKQSNPVMMSLGARLNAGFFLPGEDCPDPERFLPYPEHEPEVRRLLRLLQFLGMPLQGEGLEFPLLAEDFQALSAVMRTLERPLVDYVCIHPGARAAARRWPVERFATVADGLAAAGLQVVLTGTQAEAALTAAVARAMIAPCIDLAGRTSLGTMAALISRARLLVCNDTGVSHIAAALWVPSVVVYTASSPQRWAPANQARHRRVFVEVGCRPCDYGECPIGHPCAVGITVEQVLDQALQILVKTERAAARV